jgi:ATP-dependent Lon protease
MPDETKIKMSPLDEKLTSLVQHLVVRKDLIRKVKGNAIVPSYVLEYLLSQYCTVSDEAQIAAGIERVLNILKEHYVHRSEAGLIRSMIREKRRPHKVIDRVSVSLNDKNDVYEATFSNLGISKVVVPSETVKLHQKLLTGGVWCLADVSYEHTEGKETPWTLEALKPIQKSSFNFDEYVEARRSFSTDEWIDVLMQSIGLNPEAFSRRKKFIQLTRLIAFCERNYNLMELGSKGTGKSHVFSELSPHGMLISGGEITVPKLFVENRRPYNLGLVGHWSCVAFDEFAGKGKRVDKALVDIMKNYMANKTFSRGVETLGAEASMVFIGNTRHSVAHMLKNADLFDELPTQYHDPAFLDRLHFYIPGWEVDIVRSELFTSGFGFVIDYLAEILKKQRDDDFSQLFAPHFKLSDDLSTRDRESINKTFSGMMKLLYPHREATVAEMEELLTWAIEGRKRVKDQLLRIDETFEPVTFAYKRVSDNQLVQVSTLEEQQYPEIYWPDQLRGVAPADSMESVSPSLLSSPDLRAVGTDELQQVRKVIRENQTGIDFDMLFGPYLKGARQLTITDTYIRKFHQARNLMEFLETIARQKSDSEDVHVHLIAAPDDIGTIYQEEYFSKIQENVGPVGIIFDWEFSKDIHARHIITDHGWEILLDRGLDVFQPYDMKDAFSPANRLQKFRQCKKFEVTFRRKDR